MATIEFTVTVKDGDKTYIQSQTFKVDDLREIPNPRQALVAHFLYRVRECLHIIQPPFNF